jgi:hypothetical protein
MTHHKRKRPKHQRAGCLHCKPHKDERGSQEEKASDRRKAEGFFDGFFEKIKHGDKEHRAWLREECTKFVPELVKLLEPEEKASVQRVTLEELEEVMAEATSDLLRWFPKSKAKP